MRTRHAALMIALVVALMIARVAFAQDGASVLADPTAMIPDLVSAGGQPAALLLLGWLIFGRGGLTIGIKLSDADRAALKPDATHAEEIKLLRERYHDLANKMAGLAARTDS